MDVFFKQSGFINLKNQRVPAQKLINPTTKLIMSNVCPVIPDEKIEEVLTKKVGLKLCSAITELSAGFTNPLLKHCKSFRRAVYFSTPPAETNIPESLVLEYNNKEYRNFNR